MRQYYRAARGRHSWCRTGERIPFSVLHRPKYLHVQSSDVKDTVLYKLMHRQYSTVCRDSRLHVKEEEYSDAFLEDGGNSRHQECSLASGKRVMVIATVLLESLLPWSVL